MEEFSPRSKRILKKIRQHDGFGPLRIRYFEDLSHIHKTNLEILLRELPRSKFDITVEGADDHFLFASSEYEHSAFEKLVGLVLSGIVDPIRLRASQSDCVFTHSFSIELVEGAQWIPELVGKLKTEAAKLQGARLGDVAFHKLKFEFSESFERIDTEIQATTRRGR